MTSKKILQNNQQQKSDKSQESGILQRAAVRSVSDAGVQSTDDQEELTLSNGAFSKDFSQVPISTNQPQQFQATKPQNYRVPPIQAKLTIGEPDDRYEQEADRVASQVVQRINAPSSTGVSVQREAMPEDEEELQMKFLADSIQRVEIDDEEELQMKTQVQRREAIGGGEASTDLTSAINSARGGGQAIADNIREPMEQAFGADFSGVKVHTDGQSDQLNRSIQARAFTTGQDVFFRQGEYNPGSRGGQELLAHELTHVVQQSGVREQAIGEMYRISRTTEPIVQCVLDGTAVDGEQEFRYGLVKGNYTPDDNKVDAHIEPGGDGQGLQQGDMLSAVQDIYQAMLARNNAGGPIGEVQMRPQGAVALKTVVELLGGALGGWFGKTQAVYHKMARKSLKKLTKDKMAEELDQAIIPEHMAFLGALVEVGGVTIAPILGGETSAEEFTQNMLENTPAGKARMETYKKRLNADRAVSMDVKVSQAVLPQIIDLLQR